MRVNWLGLLIVLLMGGIGANAQAQNARITMRPGLTVNFSIYGAYSSNGTFLGDYDFVNRITEVSDGYRFDFWFTGGTRDSGSQTVTAEDKKRGTTIREFWPSGDMTAKGYVSYLAISDATFADLKAGKETPLVFDGPENPQSIKKVGEEDLSTLVNERVTKLHTIKAKGAAGGGTFWILDDPAFPMIIKGETKWKWMATSISDSGSSGRQVVAALGQSGEATTHAVLFAFNSAEIDRESKPVLDSVAQFLKDNPAVRLEVQGHTDNIGGAPFNLTLSQKRAESVKAYFVAAGIDGGRLVAKGYGLSHAVADNATPEGRAQNRRVVFRKT